MSEILKFSKVSLAILGALLVMYFESSRLQMDFYTGLAVKALLIFLIIVTLNSELWRINHSTDYKQLLEEHHSDESNRHEETAISSAKVEVRLSHGWLRLCLALKLRRL
jgi:hypothetical protein